VHVVPASTPLDPEPDPVPLLDPEPDPGGDPDPEPLADPVPLPPVPDPGLDPVPLPDPLALPESPESAPGELPSPLPDPEGALWSSPLSTPPSEVGGADELELLQAFATTNRRVGAASRSVRDKGSCMRGELTRIRACATMRFRSSFR
jgi:hypothetical protein